MTTKQTTEKEGRRHNITYTQAGVSCFVGQESAKFEVQFFVGKFSAKSPCLRIAENRQAVKKPPFVQKNTFLQSISFVVSQAIF